MVRPWLKQLVDDPMVGRLIEAMGQAGRVEVSGAWGSCAHLLAGALACRSGRPVLLVCGHLDEADEAAEDLGLFETLGAAVFPALEVLPGEAHISLEQLAQQLELAGRLERGEQPPVVVTCVQALMQSLPAPGMLERMSRRIEPGQTVQVEELAGWLTAGGYRRVEAVEEVGDFAVRGGLIDIFTPGPAGAVRVDLFGDQVEQICRVDLDTMGSGQGLEAVDLVSMTAEASLQQDDGMGLWERLDRRTIVVISQTLEVSEQGRGYYERLTDARGIFPPEEVFKALGDRSVVEVNTFAGSEQAWTLPVRRLPDFAEQADGAMADLAALCEELGGAGGGRVVVLCSKPAECDRLEQLLAEHLDRPLSVESQVGYLYRGFCWGNVALVPHHELFHRYTVRRRVRQVSGPSGTEMFYDLSEGDYVVHVDHGIARFKGLGMMRNASGLNEEYLTLQFADRALLHVPVTEIDRVQKYVGGFAGRPPLSKLGGGRWAKQKRQAAESVRNLAAELLRVQAARSTLAGIRYGPDTEWMRRFEAEFAYEETDDQLAAMAEIKKDMADSRPMDRLLCGDVGYGKTELAIRAAFKAIEHGRQVAVLCPTTVLCEQHERTFRQRMADYPIRIESLSRFKSPARTRQILAGLADGTVDLVIGTHRLLSDDVTFKNLGLVVVDEEQRFGVEHKNKLMRFRVTVDVLTMSATPIPRTLHLALLGLRSISSLATPPADRRAVVTEVVPYQPQRIRQAIVRELNRDGQCYFVHNRVRSIEKVADQIARLVPEARVAVGHGQMRPRELEQVMCRFIDRQIDVLVCTTIIESGIDIPTANTILINDADRFGLAELHQLRGRVGRYKHRAYCYLLLPRSRPISEVAARRLRAIEQFSMLGAGFKIAMRDMEIRGVGNILGPEQSGHIATVGYQMYCQMLEQARRELCHEPEDQPVHTHLDLALSGHLPRTWIASVQHRLAAYRRIASARSLAELEQVERDLEKAWGPIPEPARCLLDLAALRIGLGTIGVMALKQKGPDLIFTTTAAGLLYERLEGAAGSLRLVDPPGPDKPAGIYYRPPSEYLEPPQTLLAVLRQRFVAPLAYRSAPAGRSSVA